MYFHDDVCGKLTSNPLYRNLYSDNNDISDYKT